MIVTGEDFAQMPGYVEDLSPDTEDNVQIAHLVCNERKGAQVMAHAGTHA